MRSLFFLVLVTPLLSGCYCSRLCEQAFRDALSPPAAATKPVTPPATDQQKLHPPQAVWCADNDPNPCY